MGLDFTTIQDRDGVACFMIHTGQTVQVRQLEHLKGELEKLTNHSIVMLDVETADGERVRDFYDIPSESLPAILLVRDDDAIANQWSGSAIPDAATISYNLNQVSTS